MNIEWFVPRGDLDLATGGFKNVEGVDDWAVRVGLLTSTDQWGKISPRSKTKLDVVKLWRGAMDRDPELLMLIRRAHLRHAWRNKIGRALHWLAGRNPK